MTDVGVMRGPGVGGFGEAPVWVVVVARGEVAVDKR